MYPFKHFQMCNLYINLFVCLSVSNIRQNDLTDWTQTRPGKVYGWVKIKKCLKKMYFFNSLSPHLLIILISNSIYFKFKGTVSIHAKIEMADL